MDVLTYSDARNHLKEIMDKVIADRRPVRVTRKRGEAVVIVRLAEWNAIAETAHLTSSPENSRRLAAAIDQLEA